MQSLTNPFSAEDTTDIEATPYLPIIHRYAEQIVKKRMYLSKLKMKQSELATMYETCTLPLHTPKAIVDCFENADTEEEQEIILKMFLRDRDHTSTITTLESELDEVENDFHLYIATFMEQGNLTEVRMSKKQADSILATHINRITIKYLLTQEKHIEKSRLEKLKFEKKNQATIDMAATLQNPEELAKAIDNLQAKNKQLQARLASLGKGKGSTRPKPKPKHVKKSSPSARPSPPKNGKKPAKRARDGNQNLQILSPLSSNLPSILSVSGQTRSITKKNEKIEGNLLLSKLVHPIIRNNGFTNLTSFEFPESIKKILGWGIKHALQPNKDLTAESIKPVLVRLGDRIKWKYYFEEIAETSATSSTTYNPAYRLPPTPFNDTLGNAYIRLAVKEFINRAMIVVTNSRYNQPELGQAKLEERSNKVNYVISNLQTAYPHIKFVAADKNLGLVALGTMEYHSMVMTHLNLPLNYKIFCLKTDTHKIEALRSDFYIKLENLVSNLDLSKREKTYLFFKANDYTPKFHMLMKIHKNPVKGRPIVGATKWITTNLSVFLDQRLQQLLPRYPAILKDSRDLINRWQDIHLQDDLDWLVSLDVESLYTNIIVEDVLTLLATLDPTAANLFDLIRQFNIFEYNDTIYQQIDGIAMGSNCAVSIANAYMGHYLDLPLATFPGVSNYVRFIDDIGLTYRGRENSLVELIARANELHRSIRFTYVRSHKSLDILDLTFYKDRNGSLQYKTYQKSMNRYLYIPSHSNHPPSTISGFLKGELYRYSWSNSKLEDQLAIRKLFFQRLLARGYSKTYLFEIFRANTPIKLSSKQPRTNSINPLDDWILVLPYTNSSISKTLIKWIKEEAGEILPYSLARIIPAWTPAPSIGRLLLRSTLTTTQKNFVNGI